MGGGGGGGGGVVDVEVDVVVGAVVTVVVTGPVSDATANTTVFAASASGWMTHVSPSVPAQAPCQAARRNRRPRWR